MWVQQGWSVEVDAWGVVIALGERFMQMFGVKARSEPVTATDQ